MVSRVSVRTWFWVYLFMLLSSVVRIQFEYKYCNGFRDSIQLRSIFQRWTCAGGVVQTGEMACDTIRLWLNCLLLKYFSTKSFNFVRSAALFRAHTHTHMRGALRLSQSVNFQFLHTRHSPHSTQTHTALASDGFFGNMHHLVISWSTHDYLLLLFLLVLLKLFFVSSPFFIRIDGKNKVTHDVVL